MNAPAWVDPYLTLPLHGLRLIEASAGTGKTFTLATLVTRLVVEQGLRVGQVLAVTFTEAATQELRKRIRERLERAAKIAREAPGAGAPSAEDALSHAIIERHLAGGGESRARLARRLQQAALEIDLAAIFTIHGICARVLREHALESGHAFDAPTLLTSDAALREELAADLWRALAAEPESALLLPTLWSGPAALKDDLPALLSRDPLRPAAGDAGEDPTPALDAAASALCAAIAEAGEQARAEIARAFDDKVFDGRRARRPSFDKAWDALCRGVAARDWVFDAGSHLDKLLPDRLRELCRDGLAARAPCSRVFDALADWAAAADASRRWRQARAIALLHRVRADARARLAELKRARRLQTFDDLLDGVADALDGARGDALVAALRAQYRFALVDEFQDTDARQWAIFRRVFGRAHGDAPPALFLIGDPKQAIYGFRGGDVHTYLQAHAIAEHAPPLDRNFRSRPSLLQAVAGLYAQAGADAFADPRIRFQPVRPGGRRGDADFERGGAAAPALTVRRIERDPDDAQAGPFSAERSRALATRACVAEIHALLADARAGHARLDGRPLQPGDLAVLVRSHHEATRIQRALAAAGI
ncbi:MAG: UvrD-helicase domain-containing protein, partial [Lysobacteraceae bacterium]